jgi:hypothetical protein
MSRTRNATLARVSGLIVATGFYLFYLAAPAAADQRVSWMSMRNVAINGDVLQKTGGCQGCEDAGAISQQTLYGDGFVQFTPGETNTFWYGGLTRRTDTAQHADMDFAFRFNGAGAADVVENGTYRGGDTSYAAGDVFRIAIVNGRVQYLKNGAVLFESQQPPRFPLAAALSLGDVRAGDTITIDAYGTVRLSADSNDVADPLGSHVGRRAADAPLKNSPAGALVARIGNATILIGDHRTLTRYPFSGRLYLGVNDDYLIDNSGQYTASVNVEPYRR